MNSLVKKNELHQALFVGKINLLLDLVFSWGLFSIEKRNTGYYWVIFSRAVISIHGYCTGLSFCEQGDTFTVGI